MFNNKLYKVVDHDRQGNKNDLRGITSAYTGIGRVRGY